MNENQKMSQVEGSGAKERTFSSQVAEGGKDAAPARFQNDECQKSAITTSEPRSEMAPASVATTPAARRQALEDVAFGQPDPLWVMAVEIAALRGCRPGVVPAGKLYWECQLDETHVLRVNARERTCSVWQRVSGTSRLLQLGPVWVMRAWLEAHDADPMSRRGGWDEKTQTCGGCTLDEIRCVLQTALENARLDARPSGDALSSGVRAVDQALFVLEQVARRSADQSSRALAQGAANDLRPVVAEMLLGVST